MNCRECQNIMVDALYDELEAQARGRFESHVVECTKCADLFAEMRTTLNVMDQRQRPDPGENYWVSYFDRLRTRMAREEYEVETKASVSWWQRVVLGRPVSSWSVRVAAGAAILLIGIVAGRTLFVPAPADQVAIETPASTDSTTNPQDDSTSQPPIEVATEEPGATNNVPSPIDAPEGDVAEKPKSDMAPDQGTTAPEMRLASATDVRAQRYIEHSQMLLLAIVNNDPEADGYTADFAVQQARSRELINEADGLKDDLQDAKQRRLRELVAQLQRILREIANLEADDDLESVDLIRSQVNRNDVMLKINLEQMRLEDKMSPASSDDEGRSF